MDPDKVDRGKQAHADTQDALAAHLRSCGIEPRSSEGDEPEYDLAWQHDGVVYVAEIKSTTPENEEKQLRLGLGQVLRYRHQLGGGAHQVVAVLVPERDPTDDSWSELCQSLGVVLVWPGEFASLPS